MTDLTNYNDHELWSLVRLNDRGAFNVIYERHWSILMISAYNVLQDKEVCKDIIQDVFSDLWIRRKTLFITSLRPYLKVAVRNQVFKHLRRGYLTREHLKSLDKMLFVDATEQMVNYNQMKELYEESVSTLPEKCREVFLLSRAENLAVNEIARKLGISPKTVENQITKALKHLRNNMGEILILFVIFFLL